MTWHCFQLTYELHSPLHVGYHRIANLQRTRYYLPARNLWGAVTERLTRSGFGAAILQSSAEDYSAVGDWVKAHCAFGYFFIWNGSCLLSPDYDAQTGDLRYGNLSVGEFEQVYLASHVTTALEAATTSAEIGSLHEIETITSITAQYGRTFLRGDVFLDEEAVKYLGDLSKWQKWLGELMVGGERRYGFGRLRLSDQKGWVEIGHRDDFPPEGQKYPRPQIRLSKDDPLQAHACIEGLQARGGLEPLVGRETRDDSQGFGRALTNAQICWTPGSRVSHAVTLEITRSGWWQKVE